MRAVDIIRKKRDASELTRDEIYFFVDGVTHSRIPDYQTAAWLMAVVWRGMSRAELAALTQAMIESGATLDWSELPAAKVDKHSTGGGGTVCADDQRPRAWAHGRHARQARVDPRISRQLTSR